MEMISICENLDKLGVPIPKFVKKALRSAEEKITQEKKEEIIEKTKKKGGRKNAKSNDEE